MPKSRKRVKQVVDRCVPSRPVFACNGEMEIKKGDFWGMLD